MLVSSESRLLQPLSQLQAALRQPTHGLFANGASRPESHLPNCSRFVLTVLGVFHGICWTLAFQLPFDVALTGWFSILSIRIVAEGPTVGMIRPLSQAAGSRLGGERICHSD